MTDVCEVLGTAQNIQVTLPPLSSSFPEFSVAMSRFSIPVHSPAGDQRGHEAVRGLITHEI